MLPFPASGISLLGHHRNSRSRCNADSPGTQEQLLERGWSLVDSYKVSLDLERYQDYISISRGELTVAKDLFARTRSGWFSDRSVCYLATGKPVITLETGFSKFIPSVTDYLHITRRKKPWMQLPPSTAIMRTTAAQPERLPQSTSVPIGCSGSCFGTRVSYRRGEPT